MAATHRARSGLAAKLGLFPGEPLNHGRTLVGLALASLVAVGFAMRIANLGEYALSLDESTIVWASAPETFGQLWQHVTVRSPHPPAIFFLVHAILNLTWDPLWLRLPMVLCGTLLIPAAYAFGRELVGRSAGLTLSALVTFSPAMVELSRTCRNYTPGFLLLVLCVTFMVGFLRTGKWRALAISGAAAALAIPWHYGLLIPIATMGLVLAGALLSERAPARRWLLAGACQAPIAAVFGLLYWQHLSRLPEVTVDIHKRWHKGSLSFSISDPLGPLADLYGYLAPAATAFPLTLLTVAGALALVLRRRWLALAVCGAPLLVAYTFMARGDYPLGGSRHSAYLFLFVFGLVAALVPELITGTRTCVDAIARWLGRARPAARTSTIVGSLIATSLVGVFAATSLAEYAEDRPEYVLLPDSAHGSEVATHYTRDRIERSFALIEERAGQGDIVLMNIQGLFALRMRLQLRPLVSPTLQQRQDRDVRLTMDPKPLRAVHNGVTYYSSKEIGFQPTPIGLRKGLEEVKAFFDLPEPERVWIARNGWEHNVARVYPHLDFDREIDRLSEGWVISIAPSRLPRRSLTKDPPAKWSDAWRAK